MSRVIDNTDYRDATPAEQTEIDKKIWGGGYVQNIITPDHTWKDGYFQNSGAIGQNAEYVTKYSPEYIKVDPNIEYLVICNNVRNSQYGWYIAEYNYEFIFQQRQTQLSTSYKTGVYKFNNPYIRVSLRTFGKADIKIIPLIEEDKIIVE